MNLTRELVNIYCPRPEIRLNAREYFYSYNYYLKTADTLKKVIDNNIFTDESVQQFTKILDKMLTKNRVIKKYRKENYDTFQFELYDKLADHSLNVKQLKTLNRKLKLIVMEHKFNNSFQANPFID